MAVSEKLHEMELIGSGRIAIQCKQFINVEPLCAGAWTEKATVVITFRQLFRLITW